MTSVYYIGNASSLSLVQLTSLQISTDGERRFKGKDDLNCTLLHNQSQGDEGCYNSSESGMPPLYIVLAVLFYTLCAIGLIANCVSLTALACVPRPFKPKLILIMNLAITDIVNLLFVLITDILYQQHLPLCDTLINALFLSFFEISGLTALSLAMDMFIAVCAPLKYSLSITRERACVIIACIWSLIIGKGLVALLVGEIIHGEGTFCNNAFPKALIYISVGICVAILLISLWLYVKIFIEIKKHRCVSLSEGVRLQSKRELKTAVTLVLLFVTLLVSWGPWVTTVAAVNFSEIKLCNDDCEAVLVQTAIFLIMVNPLADPLIYGIRMPDIRQGILRLVGRRQRPRLNLFIPPPDQAVHTNLAPVTATTPV